MNVAHILLDGILIQDGNLVDYFGKKIQWLKTMVFYIW